MKVWPFRKSDSGKKEPQDSTSVHTNSISHDIIKEDKGSNREYISLKAVEGDSYAIQQAKALLRQMNQQELTYFDLFQFGTKVIFEEFSLDVAVYFDVISSVFASFPDLRFRVEAMEETTPGIVTAKIWVDGHHTGDPYHTPLHQQSIQRSDHHVRLDPEIWVIHVKKIKISELRVTALGKYTGPNGLYELLQKKNRRQKKLVKKVSAGSAA